MAAIIRRLSSARALLNWLKTVDGSGSGLDADTVDGRHVEEGTYTPTVTSTSGTITSVTNRVGNYLKVGSYYSCVFSFTIADNGTGAGFLQIGLPAALAIARAPIHMVELTAGQPVIGGAVNGNAVGNTYNIGGSYPGGTGKIFTGVCFFKAAS